MKAKIRVPVDQYAFIEIEAEGTPEQVKDTYDHMKALCTVGGGLDTKEWMSVLDRYLETNQITSVDDLERMSKGQQDVIQEIKRSIKRLTYKNNK